MQVRKEVLVTTAGEQVPWNQDSLLDRIYLREKENAAIETPQQHPKIDHAQAIKTRRSIWFHNGSELLLQASGNTRAFYYSKPSSLVKEAGVKPGTLLFEGKAEGNMYTGTAYRFSSKCAARSYSVKGPIKDDGRKVVLIGTVRRLDVETCSLLAPYNDELSFTYLHME